MESKTIVIAGGTGFLGHAIIKELKGYNYIVLCRHPKENTENVRYIKWNGISLAEWAKSLEGSFAIINLTGRSVDCRYNEKNKKEILESRVNSTAIIGKAIQECKNPPELWINAGSATIYRHALDRAMDEETGEYGYGFSVDVCKAWETAFNDAHTEKTRKVILRISMVMGKSGGVLPVMKRLVRLGLGGKQGSGDQYMSWIHIDDFVQIVKWIIEHKELKGSYNCTAPNPVTNKAFMHQLRKLCKMSFGLPAPKWILEIGALIIQTETELLLKSRRVIPTKLLRLGFKYKYSHLEEALEDLLK